MNNNNTFTKDYKVVINDNANVKSYNTILDSNIGHTKIDGSCIDKSSIRDDCNIRYSTISSSVVGNGANIGVYSHLRPNSTIMDNARIGNFVETKQSTIGNNSKVAHLTYVGDAIVGNNVNVGCGTVFCNYNGVKKQKTVVGNNVFIGSNSNLVAPLNISDNSFIAAGSTITLDVPQYSLAIARARQVNKEDYLKPKIEK